jgi:hypothetical protein
MSDVVEQYTIRPIPGSARHGVRAVVTGGLYWLATPDRRARRDAPVTRLNRSL